MLEKLDLRNQQIGAMANQGRLSSLLPRPVLDGSQPVAAVEGIIDRVRNDGDQALIALTRQFDGVAGPIRVEDDALKAAETGLSVELVEAFSAAIRRIRDFHEMQIVSPHSYDSDGVGVSVSKKPVRRAGLYVPGGKAEYPSTLLMTAIPAQVAGVEETVLCVPPSPVHGGVAPTVLAAASMLGVDEVYAVGGAQAIAAMAYGTESIAPVDVIAGPGNVYVALAKRLVAGDVGVAAAFAGPSEIVVVADGEANPTYVAIDIIVQAEHGPDGLAWLVTWDERLADAVIEVGDELVERLGRSAETRSTLDVGGRIVLVNDETEALAIVDAIAPEHLQLQCRGAERMANSVRNAGAIFCGPLAPAALGDYLAGPSHVLPTYGSARFSSALTIDDFLKDHHVVSATDVGLQRLGPHVMAIAETEGLFAHAEAIRLRLDDLTN